MLQHIGIYVYFVSSFIYVFLLVLLITPKATITSFSRIFLIIMLCILPDYIYHQFILVLLLFLVYFITTLSQNHCLQTCMMISV